MAPNRINPEPTPAFAVLNRAGIGFTPHSYVHDPRAESFGAEASEALGIVPERVFKTLMVDVDDELCVGIVPVVRSLDLKCIAAALGGKRSQMSNASRAQRATGYVLGGISPLGQKNRHRTVIDTSAQDWPTVFVSGGRRGLEAELSPDDLIRLTNATVARISR